MIRDLIEVQELIKETTVFGDPKVMLDDLTVSMLMNPNVSNHREQH